MSGGCHRISQRRGLVTASGFCPPGHLLPTAPPSTTSICRGIITPRGVKISTFKRALRLLFNSSVGAALVALILATPATATGPTRHSLVQFAFANRSDASSIVVHGSEGECERRRCWVRIKFKLNPVDEWARCSALLVIRPRTWNVARSDCPWALNAQKPADG